MFNTNPFISPNYDTAQETSELMTPPELAQWLGIGRNRAYELLRDGTIKGFRIGTTWKVSREAVEKYIREQSRL